MIRLDWGRWLYDMFNGMVRHSGTALLTCGALTWKHWNDVHAGLSDVGVSILAGAIIPTLATFFRDRGLPPIIDDPPAVNVTAAPGSQVTVNLPDNPVVEPPTAPPNP